MKIALKRKFRTMLAGQARKKTLGRDKRIKQYDYIYLTTCSDDEAEQEFEIVMQYLEYISGEAVFNIQLTWDDVGRVWTIRFTSLSADFESEIIIDTDEVEDVLEEANFEGAELSYDLC